MNRLRITPDGRIRGLWTDAVDFTGIGRTAVRRASHVEFDGRLQKWFVREAIPRVWWRWLLQLLIRQPCGRVLHRSARRADALAWEAEHFGPGGDNWGHSCKRSCSLLAPARINGRMPLAGARFSCNRFWIDVPFT